MSVLGRNACRVMPEGGEKSASPRSISLLAPYAEHWARLRDAFAAGWETQPDDSELLRAAIGHALNFQTWRSLAREENLDDAEAVTLMVAMIRCVAHGSQGDSMGERVR